MKFMAPRTDPPTRPSPSTLTAPAARSSADVVRPQPRRMKSMFERERVTVGATSSPAWRARPPSTAIVKDARVVSGTRHVEADGGAVGAPRLLADDEGHGALDVIQGDLRGHVPVPARAVEGAPNVLLVHPAVEDPHPHELGVRHLAHRAVADGGPALGGQCVQLGHPGRGHLDELGPHGRPGQCPAHGDEALVRGREVVLHVVAQWPPPLRNRLAHDRPLDPDEVGELILDVPAGALGGQGPLGLGKLGTDPGQRPPRLPQRISGPQPAPEPVTVLTCTVVAHGADPSPGSCLKSPDHPPIPGTPPLRSTPVQGHHRPKELPWLTTRGTA